jgi:HAD superfamily hydrolase (TIGR01509 family)
MFKAVIFDMDGVIVDSEPAHYNADNALFEKLGIKLSAEERELFLGVSSDWMWNYILARHSLKLSKKEILALDVSVRSEFLLAPNHPRVNSGLELLLQHLKNAGLLLAVASSTVAGIMKPLLIELDLLKYFNHIAAGDQVEHAKPAPDVFLLASHLLKVSPAQCLAIEDSPNGIKAAKAAGMKCIGYSPLNNTASLSEADFIIRNFDQLRQELKEILHSNLS